eukprot:scaffold149373_cov15-Tisochrysis_lutea.AAC.1
MSSLLDKSTASTLACFKVKIQGIDMHAHTCLKSDTDAVCGNHKCENGCEVQLGDDVNPKQVGLA